MKCEHWCFYVKQCGRSDSILTVGGETGGRGWGGVGLGGSFEDISAVVVEGGNGVCFCLHFIPFLMVPF